MDEPRPCRRCHRPVVASAADYEVFEQMHYVCFHYEFEHRDDPDVECEAGGCPAAGISHATRMWRTAGADIAQAGDTVVPAILVLRDLGYVVEKDGESFVARTGASRFSADDPVALLGLVRIAESRCPWRATDAEIDRVLNEFDL